MKLPVQTIGKWLLAAGVAMLAAGIVLAFTLGTPAVPVLVSLSIVVNTAGITLLRWK